MACPSGGDCTNSAKIRANCKACRFKKCLEVGMDTGRVGRNRKMPTELPAASGSPRTSEQPTAPIDKEEQFKQLYIRYLHDLHNGVRWRTEKPDGDDWILLDPIDGHSRWAKSRRTTVGAEEEQGSAKLDQKRRVVKRKFSKSRFVIRPKDMKRMRLPQPFDV